MNKYRSIILWGILFWLLPLTACEKTFTELNTDPNEPLDVPLNLILPSAQANTAFTVLGTDMSWYASLWVQHTAGIWNQMFSADRLEIQDDLVNNTWNGGLYTGSMMDLKLMIDKATEDNLLGYLGVAKILMAYNLAIATDSWGRVPYSQAFQLIENLKPAYDNQQDLYNTIQTLLNEGVNHLQDTGAGLPTSEDLIYGGSKGAWIKAAHALQARYHLRLTKRDEAGSAQKALDAISAGAFESSSDDMLFNTYSAGNPWWQFSNGRKQHAISTTIVNILSGLNDPRLPLYGTPIGDEVLGAPNATADQDQSFEQYSWPYDLTTEFAPLEMMTFIEQKFIEAEANFRLGNNEAASAAYETAILESLAKTGVTQEDIDTYIAQTDVFPGPNGMTLERIITQKYISQYLQQSLEAYNDWRRTDIPALSNPLGDIPRRFPYPVAEKDTNGENVPSATINAGVWWDDGTED